MRSKMLVNTKARQALAVGRSNFGDVYVFLDSRIVLRVAGGRGGMMGRGLETCSQARLSLSWMKASHDASDAGHGRCDAFRAARRQIDLCCCERVKPSARFF